MFLSELPCLLSMALSHGIEVPMVLNMLTLRRYAETRLQQTMKLCWRIMGLTWTRQ
jgi:hypothetical protein